MKKSGKSTRCLWRSKSFDTRRCIVCAAAGCDSTHGKLVWFVKENQMQTDEYRTKLRAYMNKMILTDDYNFQDVSHRVV